MPSSVFQKRAVFFLIFSGIIIIVLLLLPFFESVVQSNLLRYLAVEYRDGVLLTTEGGQPAVMSQTSVSLVDTLFKIAKIVLWMALVIGSVRFVGYLVMTTAFRSSGQSEVSSLVKTVLSIIIYIVAFFIIFQSQYPDVPLAPLFTGSTILGIVVGLALQDTLGNLFAGIALQADQPFQVGDVIAFVGREGGIVESVSWRGVKIRTFQNKILIISNSVLGKEIIEVAPRGNLNARLVLFNTLYVNSPAKTIQVLRDAVRQIENVSQKIRPVIRIRSLADNGIDWEIKYWLDDYTKYNDTDALIRQRVWYVFNREGIDFAFPTRTVHIAEKRPEATLVEYANAVAEHLHQVPLFLPLAEEELQKLAESSTTRVYAPAEAIVRRGQEGNSMFVITRGAVKVQIPENDYQKTINHLKAKDFFGEMSLLTGQPRTATVIAEEETEVIQIRKAALKPLFEANPDLMESMSAIIEERRALLVQKEEEEEAKMKQDRTGVLSSLRKFFGFR